MRIWLDVLTPKQVLFLYPLRRELLRAGHEVLLTTREHREVRGLLELLGVEASVMGTYAGANLEHKLEASLHRCLALLPAVKRFAPHLALSFSSPECARVAYGLGIPHIAVNDSPHAEHVARLTIPLSALLLSPWVIPYRAWAPYGIRRAQYRPYRALDPMAWLLRLGELQPLFRRGPEEPEGFVLIRTPELASSYLRGITLDVASLLSGLAAQHKAQRFVVLPRYEQEAEELARRLAHQGNVRILRSVVFAPSLLLKAKAFVGMGGTMTAEAALLGVPSISAYPGTPTLIEHFLVRRGCVLRAKDEEQLRRLLDMVLEDARLRQRLSERGRALARTMRDPIAALMAAVESLGGPKA